MPGRKKKEKKTEKASSASLERDADLPGAVETGSSAAVDPVVSDDTSIHNPRVAVDDPVPIVDAVDEEGGSDAESTSESESSDEDDDGDAKAILAKLAKFMVATQKVQRKERKITNKILNKLASDRTELAQHKEIEEGFRLRLLKQNVEVPKWKEDTNTMMFFSSLEEIYTANNIPSLQWGKYLQHQLSGRAAEVYLARFKPCPDIISDFKACKRAMLTGLGETVEAAERDWWLLRFRSGESLDTLSIRVQTITQKMLSDCSDINDVVQFIYLSRFLSCLPEEIASHVRVLEPKSIHDAVRLATQCMGMTRPTQSREGNFQFSRSCRRGWNQSAQSQTQEKSSSESPRSQATQERTPGTHKPTTTGSDITNAQQSVLVKGSQRSERFVPICHLCNEPGHIRPNCPKKKSKVQCINTLYSSEEMLIDGLISGVPCNDILVDTGATRTLVSSKYVPQGAYTGESVTVTGFKGNDETAFPIAHVKLEVGEVKGHYDVAVSDALPQSALIGLDVGWEPFESFITTATERRRLADADAFPPKYGNDYDSDSDSNPCEPNSSAHHEPSSNPCEPSSSAHHEPSSNPCEPSSSAHHEPSSNPCEPSSNPCEPSSSAHHEPSSNPCEPSSNPCEPSSSAHHEPSSNPCEPSSSAHHEPSSNPCEPSSSAHHEPSSNPSSSAHHEPSSNSCEASTSDTVRLTLSQAKARKAQEIADLEASSHSLATPMGLDQIQPPSACSNIISGKGLEDAFELPIPSIPADNSDREVLSTQQLRDPTLTDIRKRADQNTDGYCYYNGMLAHESTDELGELCRKIVLPKERRNKVLLLAHSVLGSGHFGHHKTHARLVPYFTWPGMRKDVNDHCRSCEGCQKASPNTNSRTPLVPLPVVNEPFNIMAINIVGPLPTTPRGHKYLLTAMCLHTKYPEAITLKRVDTEAVVEALMEIVSRHGIPHTLLTDQGSVFMSGVVKSLCKTLAIVRMRTSPYHPQTDGALERWHACLKGMIKHAQVQKREWDVILKYALLAYRDTPHVVTGYTPFELLYGGRVHGPLRLLRDSWFTKEGEQLDLCSWLTDMKAKMAEMSLIVSDREHRAKAKMKIVYDKGSKEKEFEPGTLVLVRKPGLSSKLGSRWDGPYPVAEKLSPVTYAIHNPAKKNKVVLHANLLKAYHSPSAQIHRIAVVEDDEIDSLAGVKLVRGNFAPTETQLSLLKSVLDAFPDVLTDKPGVTDLVTMCIETGNSAPVRSKPYFIVPKWFEPMRKEVDSLLQAGIIQRSESPWSFPIVTVAKPNGSVRLCVDYRALNALTQPDPYQMPLIEHILDTLASAQYLSKLDLNKGFHQVQIRVFLGHVVGNGQVTPADCKVAAIKQFKQPKTKRHVKQFLGLTGYYRRFVEHYADHTQHLREAISQVAPDNVVWNKYMYDEFVYLKCCLSSQPTLHLPLLSDSFLLQTDASGTGLGAVLNVVRGGDELVIAFWSRRLLPRERNYSASELECLAIVDSIIHFAPYLRPVSFVVETDHKALSFLQSANFCNGRLARWAMKLMPYSFNVKYPPGPLNRNADALSRQNWDGQDDL